MWWDAPVWLVLSVTILLFLSVSALIASNTVSATSCCHLSDTIILKSWYCSWSWSVSYNHHIQLLNICTSTISVSNTGCDSIQTIRHSADGERCTLMPLVSSSSKLPISKASAALTSPLGGTMGGVYFCKYTSCQSVPSKNACSFNSLALWKQNI